MALVEQEERVARISHCGPSGRRLMCLHADDSPAGLGRIREMGVALTIWRRRLEHDLLAELGRLGPDDLDDILLIATPGGLEPALAAAMNAAGYGNVPCLHGDIVRLAHRHAAIAGSDAVRIRLEVVDTDACRKFHADYVTVRTISTYRGQGTQWIEASRARDDDRLRVEQLKAGWVGMFKGRDWQPDPAILHRSPPLGSSGQQRLVLVIDPAPANDDAPHLGKVSR